MSLPVNPIFCQVSASPRFSGVTPNSPEKCKAKIEGKELFELLHRPKYNCAVCLLRKSVEY